MPGQKPAGTRVDHSADAGKMVSDERLDELIHYTDDGELLPFERDTLTALRELKALRHYKQSREVIAATLQYWLDSQALHSPPELLNDDRHIMSPPSWPTRGTLKKWISVLRGEPLTWASHPVDVIKHFAPDIDPAHETQLRAICDEPIEQQSPEHKA